MAHVLTVRHFFCLALWPDDIGSRYDYDITGGTGAVPSFTITFTAKGSQASDGDLTLNNQGDKTPSAKW
ncbi:hypothetical protein D3C78_1769890 [compost metagenome]